MTGTLSRAIYSFSRLILLTHQTTAQVMFPLDREGNEGLESFSYLFKDTQQVNGRTRAQT